MHEKRGKWIPIVEEGMVERSFFVNGIRMVRVKTDFAFLGSGNFYKTFTIDVPLVKDIGIGWHIRYEDIVMVLKERYPFTCSRKDLYIDFNTIKLLDNGKTHS